MRECEQEVRLSSDEIVHRNQWGGGGRKEERRPNDPEERIVHFSGESFEYK